MTTPSPENIDDDFSKATAAFLSARETLLRHRDEIADLARKRSIADHMKADAKNDYDEASGIFERLFLAKGNSLPKCQQVANLTHGFAGVSLATTDVFILSSANDPKHGQTLTILLPPSKNYNDMRTEVYVWNGHCFIDRNIGYLKLTGVPTEFIPKPTEPTATEFPKPETIDDDFSKATAAFLSARETLLRHRDEIADLTRKRSIANQMKAEAKNDYDKALGIFERLFLAKGNSLPKCQRDGVVGPLMMPTDAFILSSDPEHGQTLTILLPPSENYGDMLTEVYVWNGHCFIDRNIGYLKLKNVPSEFIPKPTEPEAAASPKRPALR